MLAIMGFITVLTVIGLIMTKKVQTMVALTLVPVVATIIIGQGGDIGTFITRGIGSVAPTGVMFIFAILFFGILYDAGTFDPLISGILKAIGKDPVKITVGTVILAMMAHLDGSGATTFLVTIPPLLPLYNKLGMKRTTLATLVALSAGTMNILPWGGPTIRAISIMESTIDEVFTPMIIPFAAGVLFVLFIAVFLGRQEKKRLGDTLDSIVIDATQQTEEGRDYSLVRPKLFLVNVAMIAIAVYLLVSGTFAPAPVFMIATSIALTLNYPNLKMQKARIDAHAKTALMMASVLFSAGAFIGLMTHTGMIEAMSLGIVNLIPDGVGGIMPIIVGVLAMPLSLLFDPDSFYFGVMPVLANAFEAFGGDPIMIARASIIGQMSTGFPVSPLTPATFLLIGLVGIDLGEHQKKTFLWAFANTILMLVVAFIVGAITLA